MPPQATAGDREQRNPQFAAPQVSLPKGGGAVRGIGEKFAANPVSGTANFTIPIAVPPGRSGFGPQLSLAYDSGAGNGPFGFGWSLSLPSITRKTDKGLPTYFDSEEADAFILSGAEDLVPVLRDDGRRWEDGDTHPEYVIHRYRPRIDGLYARIERWTRRATGEAQWRSITRDNLTTLYGADVHSRVAAPAADDASHPAAIFSWLICASYDDRGNAIVYDYAAEDDAGVDPTRPSENNRVGGANRYLKRVRYGNRLSRLAAPDLAEAEWMFEVVFDYGEGHYREVEPDPSHPVDEQHRFAAASITPAHAWPVRPDPFSSYRAGFEVRTRRRCQRVLVFHRFAELGEEPCLVRSTELDYADLDYSRSIAVDAELAHPGSSRFGSFLHAVTQCGYVRDADRPAVADGGARFVTYLKQSLPPVKLEYSRAVIREEIRELDATSLANLPEGVDGARFRWVDLDGEGLPGILAEQAGAWFYKRNWGGGSFGPLESVAPLPSLAGLGGRQQLLDLAGDGRLDLVALAGPTPGFYERTEEAGWEPFRAFSELPNLAWDQPNLRFVDLDGDGHADLLLTEDDAFTWHTALGEDGFGPAQRVARPADEESGPRLVLADGTQSVYLADFSGDGLHDLVRIRNGEVCYWPNLGHGRFGAKVTMDDAPWLDTPDGLDQRRVRLADIDGSGTTDLIYLAADGPRLYFNQCGNRWCGPRRLAGFPAVDDVAAVAAADLLGNGTACLVWSSPLPGEARRPLCYVDLMGGAKPHLLVRAVNNLGAETRAEYAASTRFFLADRNAGNPWITRLPFPVHVLVRVESFDHVGRSRFITRYAYHHGYFDGGEREFRGFGLVEQWDTEELAVLNAAGEFPNAAANLDAASHVPPVLTRTWFHTGMYAGRGRVSDYFAGLLDAADRGEYYREPGVTDEQARALLLDDTVLPDGLTLAEEREACRALKGSMLRQEVYGLDGGARQAHPYLVVEQNFTVEVPQRRRSNRHAVFCVHPRESIRYHYERDPADPRVTHALTLEVDACGTVLESAEVAYGRRLGLPELAAEDQDTQGRTLATCTQTAVTGAVDGLDDYRAPLPCETRSWELTGLAPTAGRPRLTFEEVRDAVRGAPTLAYHEAPTPGLVQKRLIEHVRTLFRRDDLSGPLPARGLDARALPFETYTLALTPGLVTAVYGTRATDTVLADEAGYVHGPGDGDWWIPSGRIFHSPGPLDTPAQELAYARQHFFLPLRFRDPFHSAAVPTESRVAYDGYDLLILETVDAVGNRVTVGERDPDPTRPLVRQGNDYRLLQPALLMDPNRNRSAVAYDALGLVAGTAVMGKPEELPVPGDRLDAAFRADLTRAEIDAFLADPQGPVAAALLGTASTRVIYDLAAFAREPDPAKKPPVMAATLAREAHASEPAPTGGVRVRVSVSYSDGFGREIQKKVQAEGGPAPLRDAAGRIVVGTAGRPAMTSEDVAPRWVGSGWTVFNNKGKPVRQYEPFFTDTHRFDFDVRIGVSPVLFYDPVGRVVATLRPDHGWEKVVFGAWRQETWDAGDTVLVADPAADSDLGGFFARLPATEYLPTWFGLREGGALGAAEQAAARKTAVHAATPTVAHADPLGRTFLTVAHNRFRYDVTPAADPSPEEFLRTRVALDVEGNQREVADALGRVVVRYDYDMLGTRLHQASMEAGERWMLNDVAGKPLYAWDSRGHVLRTEYDALRRPTGSFLREPAAGEVQVGRTVYGESAASAESMNLRGKVHEVADQAGVATSSEFDFKGNLRAGRRELAAAYDTVLDWRGPVPLGGGTFTSLTACDALNRPTELTAPDGSVVRFSYNDAGLLERVEVNLRGERSDGEQVWTPFVTAVQYDAKGQRLQVDHGNRVRTTYAYDPFTYRLREQLTRREPARFPDDCRHPPRDEWPGCDVQNLHFTYDSAGNVTRIEDRAQQQVFFGGRFVEPSADYTYDALHRLIEATGREHLGRPGGSPQPHSYDDAPRIGRTHPGDGTALGRYRERYVYDLAGNLMRMQHRGTDPLNPGWDRACEYDEASLLEAATTSNRLTRCTVGAMTETFSSGGDGYDAHGNLLRMPHLQEIRWDFRDQLRMTRRQAVNDDGDGLLHRGERTWYVYDAEGRRVRKVTEAAPGLVKNERIYLGAFEIYRRHGTNPLVRETLHVMDDEQRVALVEHRIEGVEPGVPPRQILYQISNHQQSSSLELDEAAEVVSYEEYSPFGSTTYQALRGRHTAKRHRYAGRERDAESGLTCHGLRYCAPWLCRWTACDPQGIEDGLNLYMYVRNSPVRWIDPTGAQSVDPEKPQPVLDVLSKIGFPASEGGETPGRSFLDEIGQAISGVISGIGRALSAAWEWLRGAAESAWNWITSAARSAYRWLAQAVPAAWDWLKGAASTLWNWVLAPLIRTATNAAAGALAGFLAGGLIGAVIGGLVGGALGAVHGWRMAEAHTYDWASGSGWAQFLADNTWSLPNSLVGSLWATLNIWNPTDRALSRGTGQLVFQRGWFGRYATTFGNVTAGTVVPRHERTHALQARLFGPLFYPSMIAHYIVNAVIPYWLAYHNRRYPHAPIRSFTEYFSRGVYPHTWAEEWGYAVEGSP